MLYLLHKKIHIVNHLKVYEFTLGNILVPSNSILSLQRMMIIMTFKSVSFVSIDKWARLVLN